jgi:hypothetical protein
MALNCKGDVRAFFSLDEFSFPQHALAFCLCVVFKTPRFITGNDPINISALCEADIVSGQLSIFEAIFLIPKSSIIICHTVSLFVFHSCLIEYPSDMLWPFRELYLVYWVSMTNIYGF